MGAKTEENPVLSYLRRRVLVLSAALLVVTVLPWLAEAHWLLDMFSHFRLFYFAASVALVAASLFARVLPSTLVAAAALLINGMAVLPLYFASAPEARGAPLEILHFNVKTQNRQFARTLKYIKASDADVIVLAEIDQVWLDELRKIGAPYRVVADAPRSDNFGMAVLSKRIVTSTHAIKLPPFYLPSIELSLPHDGRTLTILSTHPMPPVDRATAEGRDEQLGHVAVWALGEARGIIVGDLNATPWSTPFRRLRAETGWLSSQRGFGYQATWSASGIGIPIDHLLHSPAWVTTDRRVGPDLGSDHRPLHVTLKWAR